MATCFFGLNTLLPRLRPAIVSEATCTLPSPVSLHSSAARSSASLGRYKERGAGLFLRVSMCAFCARGPVYACAPSLYATECWEASDGSQTLALLRLMPTWQPLTKGIRTCVCDLSYGSKQTRHSGTSFIHSI